ncbi:MAG: glycerol-3-phosphate 1-O-acyltransferase PlsY [Desulfurella sp.]|uniref:glycerol-3-phosphate 1-O-acyltransferase PlsY n=2 Tax=Desulfurellaceae TaxID=117942 RepID=UPI0003E0925F|nr:glycerol-3-phosphate 1-O-acyltransferase PlsY [Desulfurella multipotens]AHF96873.1 acyl-phosphate glycerol 3-phosphate acyltransferase [Desulfurella acetivorans A63]
MGLIFLIAFFSFLIGSIPSGYLIGKTKGIDLKSTGSGNIGASNAYRVLGKKEALLTLLFDMAKGFIVVLCVEKIPFAQNLKEILVPVSIVSVVLGHDFSIFLKFKGGKGVATTYGSILIYSNYAYIGLLLWLIILKITKYASLASLLSFSITVLLVLIFETSIKVKITFLILLCLMIIRHFSNIKRILEGKEHKIEGRV